MVKRIRRERQLRLTCVAGSSSHTMGKKYFGGISGLASYCSSSIRLASCIGDKRPSKQAKIGWNLGKLLYNTQNPCYV